MFAFDPATDIWKKSDNSGHAHTYGASVLDSDTGNIYTFGGLKDMSSQGKHATDETHKATMSEAK